MDERLEIPGLSTEFVVGLAAAMKTTVTPFGEVETLIASDWYDDGPEDITGRLAFLAEASEFRRRLAASGPEDVVALCRQAASPLDLAPPILARILSLPEFDARPELVIPLISLIESSRRLDLHIVERALDLCRKAGAPGRARTLIMRLFALTRRGTQLQHVSGDGDWLSRLLLDVGEPSAALQVLRATRPRGVRRWDDEIWHNRLQLAAQGHEALGRLNLSLRLYRKLAALFPQDAEYRDKIALLEALMSR